MELTIYERIIRAAGRGKGLRLSAEDVWNLAQDDAIRTAAESDGTCSVCYGTGRLASDGGRVCSNCDRGRFR